MDAMSKKNPPTGDRHLPHKVVRLDPNLYNLLKVLADRNKRPVSWEIRLALAKHLEENGLATEEKGTDEE
jgi:predicted transcriptional regulator